MSFFAEYIAWGIIAITMLGLTALTIGSFMLYAHAGEQAKNVTLIIGIASGLVTILACVCVYCGWNSLKTAIDVVDASADFLAGTKRIILVPFVYFIILLLFFFFWIGCVICVYSMGTIKPDNRYSVDGVYVP